MTGLSRKEIGKFIERWLEAWDTHDLEGVLAGFTEDIVFENWSGIRVEGRENLRRAWKGWFAEHGGFKFYREDIFIDEQEQKVLFSWRYEGDPFETDFTGTETRRGVDVLHLRDGLIAEKLTYSKTVIEIDGKRVALK